MAKHGKRHVAKATKIDPGANYATGDAVRLVKETCTARFDATVEIHLNLGIDPRKGDQQIRTTVALPHGTGKTKRIAAFVGADREAEAKEAGAEIVGGEELIGRIKETEQLDFDVAIAVPEIMGKLAGIAKLLGPRGLMPSPKSGTVTTDVAGAIAELRGGRVAFRNDDSANIHQAIGKVSWEGSKIEENLNVFLQAIRAAKPTSSKGVFIKSATLTSSMGPGIKIAVS
jgi:large subunit ribosomal protein L1